MTDLAWTAVWIAALAAGAAAIVVARALGLAATYVRDGLHVGASVWVLGWPAWDGAIAPVALAATVTVAVALVPIAARRVPAAARVHGAVTDGDERWTGLVHYALAFTGLTAIAVTGPAFAAAVGLLALSLGDGPGGAIGRRFGRHRYRLPWAKPKSLEGSLIVALGAGLGVIIAGRWFGHAAATHLVLAVGAIAALVEAAAPRGTDNLLVPAAAWATAELLT